MMGRDARAQDGKWHGGGVQPVGYDFVNGELVVNDYEAMQVKEIADLFVKGTPVRTIERIVNEKGYRHKHGTWAARTIRGVLSNPVNIGLIKNRNNLHEGIHEPILDRKTYDAIQKIMQERREKHGAQKAFRSLLGGFIYCKHCDGRYARHKINGAFSYVCYSRSKKMKSMIKDPNCKNKNYKADELESAIIAEIRSLLIDPNRINEVKENRPISDLIKKAKYINDEIEKIDNKISKMMDLYALGTIDLDVISDKVAELNITKTALLKEMDSLKVPDKESMTDEEIRSIASLWRDDLPLDDKRNIVQSLISYIEIDDEKVIIHWKF